MWKRTAQNTCMLFVLPATDYHYNREDIFGKAHFFLQWHSNMESALQRCLEQAKAFVPELRKLISRWKFFIDCPIDRILIPGCCWMLNTAKKGVIHVVNFIQARSLNNRIFGQLWSYMGSNYTHLHTKLCWQYFLYRILHTFTLSWWGQWLSWGNALQWAVALCNRSKSYAWMKSTSGPKVLEFHRDIKTSLSFRHICQNK
jgi:hypothetical protein